MKSTQSPPVCVFRHELKSIGGAFDIVESQTYLSVWRCCLFKSVVIAPDNYWKKSDVVICKLSLEYTQEYRS